MVVTQGGLDRRPGLFSCCILFHFFGRIVLSLNLFGAGLESCWLLISDIGFGFAQFPFSHQVLLLL